MTKVTCAFAEARISKENSVLTVMVYKCLFTVGWLYRVSPHAGELSVGEQRGGFKRLTAHAAHPGGENSLGRGGMGCPVQA